MIASVRRPTLVKFGQSKVKRLVLESAAERSVASRQVVLKISAWNVKTLNSADNRMQLADAFLRRSFRPNGFVGDACDRFRTQA